MRFILPCLICIVVPAGCTARGRTVIQGTTDARVEVDAYVPIDAGADAPSAQGECESNFDCPLGLLCVAARCSDTPPPTCCDDYSLCPAGQECDYRTCGCVAPTPNCCTDPSVCTGGNECTAYCTCETPCVPECDADEFCSLGTCIGGCEPDCAPGEYCDFGTCVGGCEPACAPGQYCDFGICRNPCESTGCPDGQYCSADGCLPSHCSNAECAAMDPPKACYPATGCLDECSEADRARCGAIGAECVLGECLVRADCDCAFVYDCCGVPSCQRAGEPEPYCPADCSWGYAPFPDANPALCGCTQYGSCQSLAPLQYQDYVPGGTGSDGGGFATWDASTLDGGL
jgi:hypothetical protein